jgi:AcrR family transcriptional regulator
MNTTQDPRLVATQNHALNAALEILQEKGVLAVTHAHISKATGISRSTLYRHWPEIQQLRNDAFKKAASSAKVSPLTNGPLRADLTRIFSVLISALNETPWGQIAPHVIAAAATDNEAKVVINEFMQQRVDYVESIFKAAEARGEITTEQPIRHLVEMAISMPYFRKFIIGLPLDQEWLETHMDLICRLATGTENNVIQSN